MDWKIYYHDPVAPERYTVFSDEDGRPGQAPVNGVICIVQKFSDGRNKDAILGSDYYAIDEDGAWFGMNADGLAERQANNIPFFHLKVGRQISTERFRKITRTAMKDRMLSLRREDIR